MGNRKITDREVSRSLGSKQAKTAGFNATLRYDNNVRMLLLHE
jgi:hypothetical protein